jgi:hypothetical protein
MRNCECKFLLITFKSISIIESFEIWIGSVGGDLRISLKKFKRYSSNFRLFSASSSSQDSFLKAIDEIIQDKNLYFLRFHRLHLK